MSGAELKLVGMDKVLNNLKACNIKTIANVVAESERTANELENYSNATAPWTDRTGNARKSIYAYAVLNPDTIIIYHGIQIFYGKYLETSNGGKYRVIQPSVNRFRSIWLDNLKYVLDI